MAGVADALLRAGLAVKLGHLRQATSSYIRDRTDEGTSRLKGYAVGAGFYAAAGIFLIAALLVGAAALFRWIEINYGTFPAFGATGGALVVLTAICVGIAAASMTPAKKSYPSLGSRLRVALRAGPSAKATVTAAAAAAVPSSRVPPNNRDHIASARNTATAVLRAPPTPRYSARPAAKSPVAQRAGVAAAVGLIGWALARRYSQPRNFSQPSAPNRPDRVRP